MQNLIKLIEIYCQEENVDVKIALAKVIEVKTTDFINTEGRTTLTNAEIDCGKTRGKIHCIKMYRNRTGSTLLESKNFVESEFERLDYKF